MKKISSRQEIREQVKKWQEQGLTVALVPTMGCFHQGHLSLIKKGREIADRLIVSLFVNPIQFGPGEDLDAYPRPYEKDSRLAEELGTDVLFCPETTEMYGPNFQTNISVTTLTADLCGAGRPGHFDGVATVVTKLFHLCQPDFAIFGEKDFQQLAMIKQLVIDLDFDLQIISCPIYREDDGLAMSSRNKYLNAEQRLKALCLSQALEVAKDYVLARSAAGKTIESDEVITKARGVIIDAGYEPEYISIVDQQTLEPSPTVQPGNVMALAVRIAERIRLIDNSALLT